MAKVQNFMMELETSSMSVKHDKNNKRHKYTLGEALQAVSEFNNES